MLLTSGEGVRSTSVFVIKIVSKFQAGEMIGHETAKGRGKGCTWRRRQFTHQTDKQVDIVHWGIDLSQKSRNLHFIMKKISD